MIPTRPPTSDRGAASPVCDWPRWRAALASGGNVSAGPAGALSPGPGRIDPGLDSESGSESPMPLPAWQRPKQLHANRHQGDLRNLTRNIGA